MERMYCFYGIDNISNEKSNRVKNMDDVKILIVDDEDIILQSCHRIFKSADYLIDTASSGEEGLEKVKLKDYDIVITDLKMAGMGGMELLKKLRENYPEIVVIIFTGFASVDTAREALKLGAFDYIPKPFTPDEIRSVVTNAIKVRKKNEQATMLDLMAIVSHELKSPVSVVHTTADTLYRGYFGNLEQDQKKIVETIIRNCQYLEDIIRSYIDLSRMEIDDLESFKKETDLIEDVITPILTSPDITANKSKITVVSDFKVKPVVNVDPNLIKIVVTNLVNNAIKYGKPDTKVLVTVYEEGPSYIFSIFNEGVGISRADMENKLFKKFGRLKQKGTEGIKGSGLGLYICKKIIEKHSGKIWAKSEAGKWVNFYFSLLK